MPTPSPIFGLRWLDVSNFSKFLQIVSCVIYNLWSGIGEARFWHAKIRECPFEIFEYKISLIKIFQPAAGI